MIIVRLYAKAIIIITKHIEVGETKTQRRSSSIRAFRTAAHYHERNTLKSVKPVDPTEPLEREAPSYGQESRLPPSEGSPVFEERDGGGPCPSSPPPSMEEADQTMAVVRPTGCVSKIGWAKEAVWSSGEVRTCEAQSKRGRVAPFRGCRAHVRTAECDSAVHGGTPDGTEEIEWDVGMVEPTWGGDHVSERKRTRGEGSVIIN